MWRPRANSPPHLQHAGGTISVFRKSSPAVTSPEGLRVSAMARVLHPPAVYLWESPGSKTWRCPQGRRKQGCVCLQQPSSSGGMPLAEGMDITKEIFKKFQNTSSENLDFCQLACKPETVKHDLFHPWIHVCGIAVCTKLLVTSYERVITQELLCHHL